MNESRSLQLEVSSYNTRAFGRFCLATAAVGALPVFLNEGITDLGYFLCLGMPLLSGLGLLSIRRGLSVDREKRTLTRWWGVGLTHGKAWPLSRSKTWPLESAERIAVRCDLPEDEEWPASYYAEVHGKSDSFTVESDHRYEAVRRNAEAIARSVGLSLEDTTLEEEPPERKKRIPSTPDLARTTAQSQGRSWIVQVPASRSLAPYYQPLWLLLASSFFVAALLSDSKAMPSVLRLYALGACVCAVLFFLMRAERSRSVNYRLRGGGQGLEIEARWTFGRTRQWIEPRELRQIDVVRAKKARDWENAELLIRWEQSQIRLGSHVPRKELRERARELRAALELPTEPHRMAAGKS